MLEVLIKDQDNNYSKIIVESIELSGFLEVITEKCYLSKFNRSVIIKSCKEDTKLSGGDNHKCS